MLAIGNEDVKVKLANFKNSLKDAVTKKDEKLQDLGYVSYLEQMQQFNFLQKIKIFNCIDNTKKRGFYEKNQQWKSS